MTRENNCNIRIIAAESVDDDGIEPALSKRTRSSLIFLAVKSPVRRDQWQRRYKNITQRTRLAFRDDNTTPIEYLLQLLQVKVALSGAGGGSSGDDCFLDGQLDDEGLHIRGPRQRKGELDATRSATREPTRTSVLEKRSLSTKSATPSSRVLLSA